MGKYIFQRFNRIVFIIVLVGLVACSSSPNLQLSPQATGDIIWETLKVKNSSSNSASFSSDGSKIAITRFGSILVLDAITGATLNTLAVSGVSFDRVAYSPDGTTIAGLQRALGTQQRPLVIFDVATGAVRYNIPITAG